MADITFNPLAGEFDFVGSSSPAAPSDIARFKKTRTSDLIVPTDYVYFAKDMTLIGTSELKVQGTGELLSL